MFGASNNCNTKLYFSVNVELNACLRNPRVSVVILNDTKSPCSLYDATKGYLVDTCRKRFGPIKSFNDFSGELMGFLHKNVVSTGEKQLERWMKTLISNITRRGPFEFCEFRVSAYGIEVSRKPEPHCLALHWFRLCGGLPTHWTNRIRRKSLPNHWYRCYV